MFKTEGTGCELVSAGHRYWTEAFAQQCSTPTVEDQMLQKGGCTVMLNNQLLTTQALSQTHKYVVVTIEEIWTIAIVLQ